MSAERALFPVAALALVACSSTLPTPPRGPHPTNAALVDVVEYPPPPAEAELVPPQPDDPACVWLDGHWSWVGRRWQWVRGEWLVPPKGCFYAPPNFYWLGSELSYLQPHWYPDNAEELSAEEARKACAKPISCGKPAEQYRP